MPHLFSIPPGLPIADVAARHIVGALTPEERPQAVIFVPTRRAAVTMREALQAALGSAPSFLPRILPLADGDQALLTVLGEEALALLAPIPPAMPLWQQRYLLAAQVKLFLARQLGSASLPEALLLADELMRLGEQCARAGVMLTPALLRRLSAGDMAEHWQQALAFLSILAEHWPEVERASGMTTAPAREVALIEALATHWQASPPAFPVFAVGSTASQPATAKLLKAIAESPRGAVLLPGFDAGISEPEWQRMAPGHPLYHLKQFLVTCAASREEVVPLAAAAPSIWLTACASAEGMGQWRDAALPPHQHIALVPCAHAESEARTVALIMREALETPGKRTALVTPDEGLMTRVATHLKRYGVVVDRLTRGTLAQADSASLWVLLLVALREPERLLHVRALLHHPLVRVDAAYLAALEPYWYRREPRRAGQLPKLPDTLREAAPYAQILSLVRALPRLARARHTASEWVVQLSALLAPLAPTPGTAAEAVAEALEAVAAAEMLGALELAEFAALVEEQFAQPLRHAGVFAHPQLVMLTPVEARLERFDRVILASMTDDIWPGQPMASPWLNRAAEAALGLPPAEEQASLAAHDVLVLGSQGELFLTWSVRAEGSITTRSRYLERLVALLAMHGVEESAITRMQYVHWAEALDHAASYNPHPPVAPRPATSERPQELPVSALDTLFEDPFFIYARYVLGLKELDAIDAEPEASDFGSLAHAAIHALTEHWNVTGRAAEEGEITVIADAALAGFADRPSIALFWRQRLMKALRFVNDTEQERRELGSTRVEMEKPVSAALTLENAQMLTLHGRIDRCEQARSGMWIGDYKSGAIPSEKEILEGYAVQLLAYALLLENPPEAIEYWQLPYGKRAGKITRVAVADLLAKQLPERFKAALSTMRDEHTPFLAMPGRFGHAYDGISRYDEWAG